MGTAPLDALLQQAIANAALPPDEPGYYTWYRALKGDSHELEELVESFVEETGGQRRPSDIDILTDHWRHMLLCLATATLQRRWLLVSLKRRVSFRHFVALTLVSNVGRFHLSLITGLPVHQKMRRNWFLALSTSQ